MAKREYERFIKRCDVEFVVNETTYKGKTSNFSMKGLFIRTNYSPEPDTIVHIVIYLPDGSTSKVTGKVITAYKQHPALISALGTFKNGMGIVLIEKDSHYLNFIKSLRGDFNQK